MRGNKDDIDRTIEKALKLNPSLKEEMERAGQALDIAFQIYNLRQKAGLTQKQLAELVGTKQSNIARIEDAEYTGYTLKTLDKVAKALKARIAVTIIPEPAASNV